ARRWAALAEERERGPQRSILAGCNNIDEVRDSVSTLQDAIHIGAPMYNRGDRQGCADLYEKTSLDLAKRLKSCTGIKETLLGGVSRANAATKPEEKAWALRHAFDRILLAVQQAVKEQGP